MSSRFVVVSRLSIIEEGKSLKSKGYKITLVAPFLSMVTGETATTDINATLEKSRHSYLTLSVKAQRIRQSSAHLEKLSMLRPSNNKSLQDEFANLKVSKRRR